MRSYHAFLFKAGRVLHTGWWDNHRSHLSPAGWGAVQGAEVCPGAPTRQALAVDLCTSLPEKWELFEPAGQPGFWTAHAAASVAGPELVPIVCTKPDHGAGVRERPTEAEASAEK